MSGSWTKGIVQFFPCETWSVNHERYWETATWSCADILYFRLRTEKNVSLRRFYYIAKVSWEKSKQSWRYHFFRPGIRMYMYTFSPYLDAVLSKETQQMKWVGILQVGIFRGKFPGGSLMERNFLGGNFPRRNFPRTQKDHFYFTS